MYKKFYILQGWLWCLVCLLSFASWFADQPVQAKADKNKLQTPNEIIITAAVYADATCKGSPIATNESPVRQGTQVFFCYFLTNSGPYTFSIGAGYAVSDLLGVLWESNEFKVNTPLVLYRPMIAELPQTTQIVTFRGLEKAGDIFVMRTISQTIVANVTSVAVATFTPVSTIQPTSTPITPSPTSPSTQATPTPASTNTSYLYISLVANALPGEPLHPCLINDCLEPNNSPQDPNTSQSLDFSFAKEIRVGQSIYATINGGNDPRDYYFLDLIPGREYIAKLIYGGPNKLVLHAYDSEKHQIDPKIPDDAAPPRQIEFKAVKDKKHYILIAAFATQGTQGYELVVEAK